MNSITVKVLEKRCEYKENPLGIDTPKPRFSWKIKALKRAAGQVSYNILFLIPVADLHTVHLQYYHSHIFRYPRCGEI